MALLTQGQVKEAWIKVEYGIGLWADFLLRGGHTVKLVAEEGDPLYKAAFHLVRELPHQEVTKCDHVGYKMYYSDL